MGKRVNETVYRVRWMRRSWLQPRSEVFLSLYKAERRLEKLRESWHGASGPNPLVWTSVESSRVEWQGGDMDQQPYAWHEPVKQRKGSAKNLSRSRAVLTGKGVCRYCSEELIRAIDGQWVAAVDGYDVCESNDSRQHLPL